MSERITLLDNDPVLGNRYEFSFIDMDTKKTHVVIFNDDEAALLNTVNPKFIPTHPLITLLYKAATGSETPTVHSWQLVSI